MLNSLNEKGKTVPLSDVPDLIKSTVPPGIRIGTTSYGKGLFAARSFKKRERLYKASSWLIPYDGQPHPFKLETDQGVFEMDSVTHAVPVQEGFAQLYGFDGLINHDCDGKTYSQSVTSDGHNQMEYYQVAGRDIEPGDELTCNYNLFYWETPWDADCQCGSQSCQGKLKGFKHMSFEKQLEALEMVEDIVVRHHFAAANPDVIVDEPEVPPGVCILPHGPEARSFRMCTTVAFKAGDVVFKNESLAIDQEQIVFCVVPLNGGETSRTLRLQNLVHTINRGPKREYFRFDTFMDHSCAANTKMVYDGVRPGPYSLVAIKDLAPGDELTCDYETFDDMMDGTVFDCCCNTSECRKQIRG